MKIECGTCRYNKDKRCDSFRNKCLVVTTGLLRKVINGEKLYSRYNYHYYLWKPIKKNYLPDELFEI